MHNPYNWNIKQSEDTSKKYCNTTNMCFKNKDKDHCGYKLTFNTTSSRKKPICEDLTNELIDLQFEKMKLIAKVSAMKREIREIDDYIDEIENRVEDIVNFIYRL